MTGELIPFALQHAVTGCILYTLYALQSEIDYANNNLAVRNCAHRFVRVEGRSLPLPAPRK